MGGGSDQIVEGVRDMVASGGVHRPYFRGVLRGSLLRGDFRLDIYFTLWRYNVVKAISLWRSAYRMVEFRERGLLGKYYSRWNRTVWMAQSQSYWKNELDHSIQQIEEQRIAWEERVEELELELQRYMPTFGKNVYARPAKEITQNPTWDAFLN